MGVQPADAASAKESTVAAELEELSVKNSTAADAPPARIVPAVPAVPAKKKADGYESAKVAAPAEEAPAESKAEGAAPAKLNGLKKESVGIPAKRAAPILMD
eukprot:gnl/TRDRNA2_/TRDRNA2_144255_c0_seq1.p1 gnl/TRDRNA2_/TRDRNA2_144255_c0~~gnl/TRDRNA2_/TRDRNA2_144255_c0_seq1.p1  ORF type:complete len:117 (+),score=32.77 gnl/TRDRNA2_/TRDRNA2_144255_c0_seq1:47-352(+)